MKKVLVINRRAFASQGFSSRSVASRIIENLTWLKENNKIDFDVAEESVLNQIDVSLYQAIVFGRHTSKESLALSERAHAKGMNIVYDLDDFMPSLPAYIEYGSDNSKLDAIAKHIKLAKTVTVPTELGKFHIDKYYGVSAKVASTGVNFEKYFTKEKLKDGSEIMYTNTDTIKLNSFKRDFVECLKLYLLNTNSKMVIITDPNQEMDEFPNSKNLGNMDWFEHKRYLGNNYFKFAIVPLSGAEDPSELVFNECKSQIKFIEYGMFQIPSLYSKTPVYEKYVENMETGIIVPNTRSDWNDALSLIGENKDLRLRIANNAFEKAYYTYHVSKTSKAWEEVLDI